MENQTQQEPVNHLDNFFNISFDVFARQQLRQISLWAKICVLSAFAGYAVSLIVAIFGHKDYSLEAEGFSVGGYLRSTSSIGGVIGSIIVGGIINYFLYRFAKSVGDGAQSMDIMKVNTGFNNLRIYFKIFGIILIVVMGLVVLGILGFLISSAMAPRRF